MSEDRLICVAAQELRGVVGFGKQVGTETLCARLDRYETGKIIVLRALGGHLGQFAGASCCIARGVLVELSFCHFLGAVIDNLLAWRAVEMDADEIAENSAAIVVAAFPHMKHAARIAETPAKGSGDLRQDGTGQRFYGFSGSLKIAGHLVLKTSIAVRASLTPRNLSAWYGDFSLPLGADDGWSIGVSGIASD